MSDKRSRQQKKRADKASKAKSSSGKKSPLDLATMAARWPAAGAYASADWKSQGSVTAMVVREHPQGTKLASVLFYVDLWCLGVKFVRFIPDTSPEEINAHFNHAMEPCEPALAKALVTAGATYARSLGFPDHKDLPVLQEMLRGIDDSGVEPIEAGFEGKPLYLQGPDDNGPAIIAHLRRTLGDGNFALMTPTAPRYLDDYDDYEDEEGDEP